MATKVLRTFRIAGVEEESLITVAETMAADVVQVEITDSTGRRADLFLDYAGFEALGRLIYTLDLKEPQAEFDEVA